MNIQERIEINNQMIGEIKENNNTAIIDGIVDVDKYLKSPKKILWILKEVNSSNDPGDWSLTDTISNLKTKTGISKRWAHTFNPIVYTTYGILKNKLWDDIEYTYDNPNIIDCLKSIAYINIKKISGNSVANNNKLLEHYHKYKEIVLDQINYINPDIMIFGNTFWIMKEDLGLNKYELNTEKAHIHIYKNKSKILIDAYHPNNKVRGLTQQKYCDSIIETVLDWESELKP